MNAAVALMLLVSFNLLLYVFWFLINYRSQISVMLGMSVTMSTSMMFGTLSGLYFGYVMDERIILATLIGMGLGGMIGFVLGISVHCIVSIEGLVSGIMGGMMGAMFGAMLSYDEWNQILKILFLIESALLAFFVLYFNKSIGEASSKAKLQSILFGVVLYLTLVIVLTFAGPIYAPSDSEQEKQHDHVEPL